MALFGSTKTPIISAKVRPVVLRTQNVVKELQNLAMSYDIKVEKLDFNLLEVQTYTRISEGNKDTEWELISQDEIYELDEEMSMLNPDFQIKQTYEIEIFAKDKDKEVCKDLHVSIGANATKCKVYLSILAKSKIKYTASFEQEFQMLINKRKIRAGIFINIFDEVVDDVISKIVAYVRVQENVVYKKTETFLVAQGYEPTPTIHDKLIMHYDKKEVVDEKTKIDYASRGFIHSVQKNELLIEYIKPQNGKSGRNCRGVYMIPNEPTVLHEPTFSVDDTINQIETDESIQYVANENGYIALENNMYLIKTDVDIGEISFKTTGSISTGLDSDVSISVKESDAIKDAIGSGMNVEVTEIDIEGNVGSNATVSALKANVSGQTHKTATIRADKLDINVHKGKAYGKNIHITRLEHGEVDGDTIEISQAIGGNIHGKDITIELCASHVKATASRRIEIKKMQGSENIFTIDPILKKDAQSNLNENNENISELKTELKNINKEMKKYEQLIKDGTASFLDIKKRLIHYKKNGVKMPTSFVNKYKQFQKMQVHLKNIKVQSETKTEKLKLLTTRTASFGNDILDARIINRDRWIGFNEIKFKLVTPPIELIYKPLEGSTDKVFGLVEIEEGEFEIQALKE